MLPGAPLELSVGAQHLADKVTTLFQCAGLEEASSGLGELCPACGVEVPLTDIGVAACSKGHRWRESFGHPPSFGHFL